MELAEWLHKYWPAIATVASSIIAYFAGVLTDPLKLSITEWREKRRLRTALYSELVSNYNQLFSFLLSRWNPTPQPNSIRYPNPDKWLSKQCWQEAKKRPILFHHLKEASVFELTYFAFEHLTTLEGKEQMDAANSLLLFIEKSVKHRELDRKPFVKAANDKDQFDHPVKRFLKYRTLNLKFYLCTRNLPADQSKSLSPASNIFVFIKRVWRGLPD